MCQVLSGRRAENRARGMPESRVWRNSASGAGSPQQEGRGPVERHAVPEGRAFRKGFLQGQRCPSEFVEMQVRPLPAMNSSFLSHQTTGDGRRPSGCGRASALLHLRGKSRVQGFYAFSFAGRGKGEGKGGCRQLLTRHFSPAMPDGACLQGPDFLSGSAKGLSACLRVRQRGSSGLSIHLVPRALNSPRVFIPIERNFP